MFIKLWLVSYKILTHSKCGGPLSPSATLPSHRAEVRCSPHRRSPFRRLGSAQTRIEPKVVFSVAYRTWASLVAQRLKCLPAMAGDLSSIPGSGRSPGKGNGNPLQYSCLENPMDGGAWWATVHGVAKSQTQLSDFSFSL